MKASTREMAIGLKNSLTSMKCLHLGSRFPLQWREYMGTCFGCLLCSWFGRPKFINTPWLPLRLTSTWSCQRHRDSVWQWQDSCAQAITQRIWAETGCPCMERASGKGTNQYLFRTVKCWWLRLLSRKYNLCRWRSSSSVTSQTRTWSSCQGFATSWIWHCWRQRKSLRLSSSQYWLFEQWWDYAESSSHRGSNSSWWWWAGFSQRRSIYPSSFD